MNKSQEQENVVASILPAIYEELLFRVLPYCCLFIGLKYIIKKVKDEKDTLEIKIAKHIVENLYEKRKSVYQVVWISIFAMLFSLAHEPDIKSFPFYFIGGFINGALFFRYGFLAAALSHATFNIFSPVVNHFVYGIISQHL